MVSNAIINIDHKGYFIIELELLSNENRCLNSNHEYSGYEAEALPVEALPLGSPQALIINAK